MERSAADDDLKTCPICGGRDGLRIRWTPDDHRDPNQVTEVGCATCEKWFAASESHWAVARWNGFAIDAWKDKGVNSEHAELHRLLLNKAQLQEQAEFAEKKIDEYLTRHIVPTCSWKPGDRFRAARLPRGIWSVRNIRAVYGWNTGPFWIVTAQQVMRSGILGDDRHEFWQRDHESLRPLAPFWKASRWSQVIVGDLCIYRNERARIEAVDPGARKLSLRVDDVLVHATALDALKVPVTRVERPGT